MSDAVVIPTEPPANQETIGGKKDPSEMVDNQSKPKRENKDGEDTAENEIKVAAKGQIKNYLGYAFRVLNKTDHRSLKIRATGNAIVKALILIELVKRRVGDLHQINQIYSMEIVTMEETKIEGIPKVESRRRVTAMDTVLSKDPLDESEPGYQQPEPKDDSPMVNKQTKKDKGGNKKIKGPKLYNALPGEDKEGEEDNQQENKQRRDRDNQDKEGKHEQDKNKNKDRKIMGVNKDEETQERRKNNNRQGQKNQQPPRSRKDNLRNIINDDEFANRNKDNIQGPMRGGRGGQRGRGGRGRGGPFDGPPRGGRGQDFDRNYNGHMNYPEPHYRVSRDEEDRYHHEQMRSYDDFHVRTQNQRGGRGSRRGGPSDMYPMHGDRGYYNGPPHQQQRYNDPYYQQNMHFQYGPPPHEMMYGHPTQRGGGGYGPPMRGGREGQMRPPPQREAHEQHGPPMRTRGGPPRDPHGPPQDFGERRGRGEAPSFRARGTGGRGRGGEPPEGHQQGFKPGFRGGHYRDTRDGPGGPPMRGDYMGRGAPQRARGRGGNVPGGDGQRGGRMGPPRGGFEDEHPSAHHAPPRESGAKVHTRSRGGGVQNN